jgi:pimeloyl-ACP methyl ester carboxylesterase
VSAEIRHEWREGAGVRLHCAVAGDGPLILFLHGFPEYWGAWRKPMEHFAARGWRTVAPDQRGYNLSDKPANVADYRGRVLSEDIARLAAQYTKEPFVLVAHDWGGGPAWSLAIARPEMLSRLVIVNSPHPYAFWRELCNNPEQQKASEYMLLLRAAKAERVLSENNFERLWRFAFGEWGDFQPPDKAAYLEAWSQPGALTGGLNWYRASPLYPPSADDPGPRKLQFDPARFEVRVPTLVLWGERDRALLPTLLDGLEACVPDLRIVRDPECSHWIVHEKPELVCREIESFIGTPRR